jgi:hypothetical protein
MKITLRDVTPMFDSLNVLMNLPLPAKDSYRLSLAAKTIQEKLVAYEQVRRGLVTKYGEKVDNEDVIRVKPENAAAFQKEMEGLLNEEIEVNFKPISIALLGENKISARDMANLSPFLCDTEEQ